MGRKPGENVDCDIYGHLCVHKNKDDMWNVTHIPSGKGIGTFPKVSYAKRFVVAVTPMLDWSRDGNTIAETTDVEMYRLIRMARDDAMSPPPKKPTAPA